MLVCNLNKTSIFKMLALEINHFRTYNVDLFSDKLEKSFKKNVCISPRLMCSPFSIPDSPEYLSIERINGMNNIQILKKFEYEYDVFLEKKFQILLLLNNIDDVFEIRDALILRINELRRQKIIRQKFYEYKDFIK